MAWFNYRYDDDAKPVDFAADPFFREPHTSSYVPSCNPIIHSDGLIYYGMYSGTAATGSIHISRPPAIALAVDGFNAPTSIISWSGWLFFATYAGSGNAEFVWYRYPVNKPDHSLLSPSADSGVAASAKVIYNEGRILSIYSGTVNTIKSHPLTPEVDTTIPSTLSMPDTNFGINTKMSYRNILDYKGKIYILGTDSTGATIYSVTGATVAVARTSLTGTAYTMALFDGYLYYLTGVNLGRFDGSTWTDVHDDITAFSGEMLLPYKGNLLIFNGVQCHKSDGTDTTTWAATASTTATDAHPGQGTSEVFHVVY